MPAAMKQLGELWKRLSGAQKALVCALLAVVVVGVVVASVAGGAPSYVLLKDGLTAAEVADALTKLDAAGVRRKVGPTRSEVYVDERDFDRARDVAAEQKIFAESAADPEWDAAAKTSLGLTEEQRRRLDLLAKQKGLKRTIESYDGIATATVVLTPAVKAFSRRDASPAKASVVLKVEDGYVLDGLQTEAIQRVVAASLADLSAENVTVADTRGVLLSRGAGTGAFGTPALERKRATERLLADKAQSALDAAFGPGRAQVRVDATLEIESLEETKRSIDPASKVTTQEKTSTSTGAARGAGGVAGAAAQAGGASQNAAAGSSSEESSASFDYDRTDTVRRREAGKIERLSVAVLLDSALAAEETKVRDLVKAAVGFDDSGKNGANGGRSDDIAVATLPFAVPAAPPPEAAEGFDLARYLPLVRYAATAMLAGGAAWWALRALKGAKAALAGAVRGADAPEETAAEKRPVDPRQKVADEIARDPQAVGALLRGWLYEGAGAR